MKKFTLFIYLFLSTILQLQANSNVDSFYTPTNFENKTQLIDASDTVLFDLSKIVMQSNHLSFPISIQSDDTVNALDFSFKYNHLKLSYDSITDLTNYLQPLAFYNPNDSVVRFTSNSFQNYQHNTDLVTIHFTVFGGQFDTTDINTMKAYLNGSVCTVSFSSLNSTGIENKETNTRKLTVYPNPSNGAFMIKGLIDYNTIAYVYDLLGNLVTTQELSSQSIQLNLENLDEGYYTLRISGQSMLEERKLLLIK